MSIEESKVVEVVGEVEVGVEVVVEEGYPEAQSDFHRQLANEV